MTVEKEYTTKLSVGDVTLEQRDIEMLDAIDRYGSMHKAADELGRSYARLQNRIVEIEEAVGPITDRTRGGSGGGGTELTETAHELRRRFERHEAELDGVAQVTESVFTGTVADRTGELATVETEIGPILALVPGDASDVQVTVRSDAVVLTDPEETPRADGTSLRNQFTGTIERLDVGDAITRVTVRLADASTIQALVTESSSSRLGLEPGRSIAASFKATAARGIRIDSQTRA
ncbi:TOBE domain-containing protein [Natronolimnohabitans sp. A-GB9]|uniref:TOBE domain-containing protein n=1 Tax=Natronolimnohabitans sp. A-GB9 TaxID=3069757 RepID=UPI0027B31BB4|nr:TOBE domain-containing protein [Natronolimnohabitans sp. A-GB9]MDQ2049404.1 TOBE domain-containing protein [Natronolimnohabitans sp. A-GB9]